MREVRTLLLPVCWPFLYFWPYLMSYGLTPGNDFHTLYYRYKLYLIDLLAQGRPVPVWSPTEAAGFPFRANPFVGSEYPLNHLLVAFYRLNGGYSEFDHVVFTIAAFSLFAVGMMAWLRILGEKSGGAILTALIFATSLKMTELIRFPNAAHAAAWIPWLLVGITLSFRKRTFLIGGLVCLMASYCLLTAGYPYFAYYTQFLAGPYILLMLFPGTRRILSTQPDEEWNPAAVSLAAIGTGCGLAVAFCFSWLKEMKQMLDATTDRKGGDWDYSTVHEWTTTDVIGSLIYPPRASMEGWYFFGIMALSLMALFVTAGLRNNRTSLASDPGSPSRSRSLLLIVGIWWLFLTLLTIGEQSPLFALMWKFYPGFSSLRVWARMNVILIPVLALLFVRSWSWWRHMILTSDRAERIRSSVRLAFIAVLITALQILLTQVTQQETYWRDIFLAPDRPFAAYRHMLNWTVIACGLTGILLLVFLTVFSTMKTNTGSGAPSKAEWFRRHRSVSLACLVLPVFSAMETCGFGWMQWADRGTESQTIREVVDIPTRLREGLELPRKLTASSVSLGSRYQLGLMSNWYFDRYVQFLRKFAPRPADVVSDPEQFREVPGMMEMLGVEGGERFFFVPELNYLTPGEFTTAARDFSANHNCRRVILGFDGDSAELEIQSDAPGYLCYIDNWDPTWKCSVDDQEKPLVLLMGTFKAVEIPQGTSIVRFFCAKGGKQIASPASPSVP